MNPIYRYDFSSFFGQTVTFWNGASMNMVQFISMIIGILLGLMSYVFQAIALYSLAKRQGIKAPWLGWVPIASFYLLGKVSDYISRLEGRNTHRRATLLTFNSILTVLSFGILTYLPAILDFILQFMVYYNYYQPYIGRAPEEGAPALISAAWSNGIAYLLVAALSVVYFVFLMRTVYVIFKDRAPRNSALMTLLCVFFTYAIGPCLFAIRKKPSAALIRANYAWQQAQLQAEAAERYRKQLEAQNAAAQLEGYAGEPAPVQPGAVPPEGNPAPVPEQPAPAEAAPPYVSPETVPQAPAPEQPARENVQTEFTPPEQPAPEGPNE